MDPKNPGYCDIAPHFIVERLPLPPDTEIINAQWDAMRRVVRLYVAHPLFPPISEGVPLREARVIATAHYHETGPHRTYTSEWQT